MLLSFQEQRQSCLVSLGTDRHRRSQEWETHPNNHRVHLLQARDEERLSHMQSDFLKDSASKRNLKYGTRHSLQLFFGTPCSEKRDEGSFLPLRTFPFCSHASQSLLQDLELLWLPSVLALSFHLPSSRLCCSLSGCVPKGLSGGEQGAEQTEKSAGAPFIPHLLPCRQTLCMWQTLCWVTVSIYCVYGPGKTRLLSVTSL